jgi:hypothetical protein
MTLPADSATEIYDLYSAIQYPQAQIAEVDPGHFSIPYVSGGWECQYNPACCLPLSCPLYPL